MAVFHHTVQSLADMKTELLRMAKKIDQLTTEMGKSHIDALKVDNERDRAKGVSQMADWLVDAEIALQAAKIRAESNQKVASK